MKRKHKRGNWKVLILLVAVSPLTMVIFPQVRQNLWAESWRWNPLIRPRENARKNFCQSNLKQIYFAMLQYVDDWDEKYPPPVMGGAGLASGATKPYGWADAIFPYAKNIAINHCPKETTVSIKEKAPGYIDYWFNGNLSQFRHTSLQNLDSLFVFGDGNDGRDKSSAAYSLKLLPPLWRTTPNSPARRHLGGANYAFAAGHVKWLKPEEISNAPGGAFTFVPRK